MSNIYLSNLPIRMFSGEINRTNNLADDPAPPEEGFMRAGDGDNTLAAKMFMGPTGVAGFTPSGETTRPAELGPEPLLSDQFMESIRQAKDTPSEAPAVRPASAPKTHTMTIMNGPSDIREVKFQQQPDGTYKYPQESKKFSDNSIEAWRQMVDEVRRSYPEVSVENRMKLVAAMFDNYQKAMLDDRRIRESELKENRMFDRQKQLQDERISAQNNREDDKEKLKDKESERAIYSGAKRSEEERLKQFNLLHEDVQRLSNHFAQKALDDYKRIRSGGPNSSPSPATPPDPMLDPTPFIQASQALDKAMGRAKPIDVPNITNESMLSGFDQASRLSPIARDQAFKRMVEEIRNSGKHSQALNLFGPRYIGSSNYNKMPQGAGPVNIGRDRGLLYDTYSLADPKTGQRVSAEFGTGKISDALGKIGIGSALMSAGLLAGPAGLGMAGTGAVTGAMPQAAMGLGVAGSGAASGGYGVKQVYDAAFGDSSNWLTKTASGLRDQVSTPEEAKNMGIFLQYLLNNGSPSVNP
jgi:hypothetical protein